MMKFLLYLLVPFSVVSSISNIVMAKPDDSEFVAPKLVPIYSIFVALILILILFL